MTDLVPLGPGAWAFIGLYLLSLIGIGWLAKRASRAATLRDFYLAGNGFGFTVLFLTLFATQYSGNTFFAFTGATYRIGYAWILSLHFMTAVVVAYLLFAPRLHRLARERSYLTPADFINDRYDNPVLTLVVTTVMIVVLCNFLLAQLMAMGRAMQGLAHDSGGMAYGAGVVVLALIMVIYGTLGGLRAVAWTDAIQGAILAVGFLVLLVLLIDRFGPLADATRLILAADLEHGTRKALPPDAARCREWLSYILAVGFGICLYPQAIQRIYAARSPRVLRRSLAVMAFMPLPTMIIAMVAGIMALAYLPGLEGASADQIFGRVLREIQNHSTLGYGLVVVTLAAVLAAMMSTADSALLSISSMLTRDVVQRHLMRGASQATLTRLGKRFSWTIIVVLIALALVLREKSSLVQLMDRKIDLLIQLLPAFIVGIRWPGLRGGPVLAGLLLGVALALLLAFGDFDFTSRGKVAGFHPGLVALLPNLALAVGGSLLAGRAGAGARGSVASG
ncbi:MAG: sodium:solute symporter family protein [Gammaproteobacteria bacterium]